MLDQFTNLDDGDLALPSSSLDLSARMRELRARQGLKQSEVARRMGLDPSIPSLWEQGKRLVPASRLKSLADALEVSVEELLDGVAGAPAAAAAAENPPTPGPARTGMVDLLEDARLRARSQQPGQLLPLAPESTEEPDVALAIIEPETQPWVVPERPQLVGWIPPGWEPGPRLQDITPALPDGYWLDPVKLEKPSAKELLRLRLCAEDRALIGDREVPGAALAERIYRHCSRAEGFLPPAGRLPIVETIFRAVLASEEGGLSDGELVETLRERSGAVPASAALLRRLRDSVRPYPIRRVDAELFRSRR
jgi:transcriptional regulator with XRE-family HTH domain